MRPFQELLRKTTSSRYHDPMLRYTQPLSDHFGINHFWYYRVTREGLYTYIGTHTEWNEYCFENHLTKQFPILRHPETQKSGISLMKNTNNKEYSSVQREAWEKFGINFNMNISSKIPDGIEAFGFATKTDHPKIDEEILNELPLLARFTQAFKQDNKKLFDIALDHQVDISTYFGATFFEKEKPVSLFCHKNFLKKMRWLPAYELTPREKEALKLLLRGYSAPHIAKLLFLSSRTVENRIATLKSKLFCDSKIELIDKARDLEAIHYLE